MKKVTNLTFSPTAQRTIHLILYIVFAIYTLSFARNTDILANKFILGFIVLLFLGIALFHEYLEYEYQNAIIALNNECDPTKAKEIFDKLEKHDFLHAYRKKRVFFDTLYYLAIYEPQMVFKLIEENNKLFRSDLDSLLIRNTSLFLAYLENGERKQAKKVYNDIVKLRGAKIKGRHISNLYNWDELEALYEFASNDFDKACKSYAKVNTSYMNDKEKVQVYVYYYKALIANDNLNKAEEIKQQLLAIKNELPIEKVV